MKVIDSLKGKIVKVALAGFAVLFVTTAATVATTRAASPDPTGNVPTDVELPVDISMEIVIDEEDIPPSPEVTIHMFNSKSEKDLSLSLPASGRPGDDSVSAGSSAIVAPPANTPPVIDPPVDAPPFPTPPAPEDTPAVDAPPLGAPPMDAPPVDLPPAAGTPPAGRP